MIRYYVDAREGKKMHYAVYNGITGKVICGAFSDVLAANHIVMCLNMYEELKDFNLLAETLQKLNDYGT
jgi:hypothetical protein